MRHTVLYLTASLILWGCSSKGAVTDAGPPGDGNQVGGDGGNQPARICRTPPALGNGPYFKDSSKQWGIDPSSMDLLGVFLTAADLDGDGFPDLIVHRVTANQRDKLTASPPERYKRLLLNKPNPKGGRMFVDVTDASGFTAVRGGGLGRSMQLAVVGDVDNDGKLDIFSGTYTDPTLKAQDPGDRSEMLLGDGKGNFRLADKSALSHKEMYTTTSAAFLDYDRDGILDLYVGFWYEVYGFLPGNQNRLYRGNGDGTFTEVTHEMKLTTKRDSGFETGENSRPTRGVTVCDVDNDGDPDILVSAYGREWNQLWRNDGDKFTDISIESGFFADDITDYTGDNQFYFCYCKVTGACAAPTPLIDCSQKGAWGWNPGWDDKPWMGGGNTFSTLCADYDNDGDMDLFNATIVHWHIGKSSDMSQILVNPGTKPLKFERPGAAKTGLVYPHADANWNDGHISAAFFDFDGDGLQDLVIMNSEYPGTRTLLYRQKPDHTFEDVTGKAALGHVAGQAVAIADFDGDGDLDAVIGTSTMRNVAPRDEVRFYENIVGDKGNWTKVRLVGKGKGGANRAAIGARVTVTAGGITQTREVQGGHGHMGLQHDLVLHFGLGTACDIEKIEVRWPDKTSSVSTFNSVRANYLITVDQASGALSYKN